MNIVKIIKKHRDEIVRLWNSEARHAASARGLATPVFDNLMPEFVSALASADGELGRLSGRRRDLIERHLSTRIRQGFDLAEIIEEIAILGRVISQVWETYTAREQPQVEDIRRFFDELNAATTAVADMFREHMSEDEQTEKRYARQLQQIASEALAKEAQPFKQRLKDAIQLIMEAMHAQAAALLLVEPHSERLVTTASVGAADGVIEKYELPDPSSFAGQVAANEEPTAVLNTLTTELHVDDALKRNGIHSLLGVRLPLRNKLSGVLYIGLAVTRPFSVRELSRIETLADRLTLHLYNAKLYANLQETSRDLQEKLDTLKIERTVRERFMSILAHDLRGPLTVAKMGSAFLSRHPERLDERRELAVKIDVNIDRVERMIRDLLDANRIQANQRLPLRLDECDLGAVAHIVVEDLATVHGERFVLDIEDGVRGIWDAEELRRALWNLAINAVKYGAAGKPITITVKRTRSKVQLSVHNDGSEIAVEDQANLFDPFTRTQQAQTSGQNGWGLGLTLVRGCAEAHGGTVTVQSSAASGTTFILHLPWDSRPYQLGGKAAA